MAHNRGDGAHESAVKSESEEPQNLKEGATNRTDALQTHLDERFNGLSTTVQKHIDEWFDSLGTTVHKHIDEWFDGLREDYRAHVEAQNGSLEVMQTSLKDTASKDKIIDDLVQSNRKKDEYLAHFLYAWWKAEETCRRLTQDNSQKDAEIRELKRQRDAVDEGEQPSQRRRLLLPGQTDYQDLSKIVAYRPDKEDYCPFDDLHPDVKNALLTWNNTQKYRDWYGVSLSQRATQYVGTSRIDTCILPTDSKLVACDRCVGAKACCIRRKSADEDVVCLYPLHEIDRGGYAITKPGYWFLGPYDMRQSKSLYKRSKNASARV